MSKTRTFPTAAVLSVTTGVLLCEFSEVQECLECVLGGPVWTHEIPIVNKRAVALILAQHPELVVLGPKVAGVAKLFSGPNGIDKAKLPDFCAGVNRLIEVLGCPVTLDLFAPEREGER